MAIARPAYCVDDCSELATTQLRVNGLPSLFPKLRTLAAVVLAMALAGCARNPDHRELNPVQRNVRAAPVRSPSRAYVHAETRQHAELRVRRPDPVLLTHQAAPNCEFKRTDFKAVDPDEWARLKIEYERQCYQDAERPRETA